MKPFNEHDVVVLRHNIDEYALRKDDVGTIVHIYDGGGAMEVEFVSGEGRTVAVVTLEKDAVRSMGDRDILHVREMVA